MSYYICGTIILHVSIVVQCSKLTNDIRICYCVCMCLVCLCGTIHSNMSRSGFGMPCGLVVMGIELVGNPWRVINSSGDGKLIGWSDWEGRPYFLRGGHV